MNVKLIHITPDAEKLIAYCARVSSPNQENPEIGKLLTYCIKHFHWSPFEMASMCVEIETSRAISAQILRHRSFSFQEFSQRYAAVTEIEPSMARRQDTKNRQNSIDDLVAETLKWWEDCFKDVTQVCTDAYNSALTRGIAKEVARMVLPMSTKTKLYMHGTIRSWIHYLQLRCAPSTQKEHRDIADACRVIFNAQLPIIGLCTM